MRREDPRGCVPLAIGSAQVIVPFGYTFWEGRNGIGVGPSALFQTVLDADDAGLSEARDALIVELESHLGVTDEHRASLAQAVETNSQALKRLTRQRREEQERAVLAAPAPAPRLSEQEFDRLARAQDKIASKSRKLRAEGKRQVLALERALAGRVRYVEEREISAAIDETVRLGQHRGEVIDVGPKQAPRRFNGLMLAYRHGVLSMTKVDKEEMLRAALLYRDLYEVAAGGRSPDRLENLAMGGVSSGFGPKSMLPQVQADQELRYARDGLTKLQRDTCDEVCGEDRTINEVAREWRKNYRTLEKALAEGLKRVGENRMWW